MVGNCRAMSEGSCAGRIFPDYSDRFAFAQLRSWRRNNPCGESIGFAIIGNNWIREEATFVEATTTQPLQVFIGDEVKVGYDAQLTGSKSYTLKVLREWFGTRAETHVAGTPGTWRQRGAATVTSETTGGSFRDGCLILNLNDRGLKRHAGALSWEVQVGKGIIEGRA